MKKLIAAAVLALAVIGGAAAVATMHSPPAHAGPCPNGGNDC